MKKELLMKRIFSLILALVMAFTLVACGDKPADANTGDSTDTSDYPNRDITVLVTFEAGGTTDVAVRTFVKYLQKYVPATINVLNISGSGGNVGLAEAVQQDPDGYYFVIQSGPFPMNAALGNVTFTYEDFEHVSMMFQSYMALAVRADSDYQTFDDFKAAATAAEPGTFKYGVYAGSPMVSTRLALEDALDVQFHIIDLDKSKSTELLAGRVEAYCDAYASFPHWTIAASCRMRRSMPAALHWTRRRCQPALPPIWVCWYSSCCTALFPWRLLSSVVIHCWGSCRRSVAAISYPFGNCALV